MAKRGTFLIIILLLSVSLVILTNFASAGFFSDFFGKITGRTVSSTCTDSDGGKDYYTGGTTRVGDTPETISEIWDACSGDTLAERYCNPDGTRGEENYPCPHKCYGYPSYCINDPGCGSSNLDSCKSETDCTSVGGKWCSYPSNYTCQPDSCPSSTPPATTTPTTSNQSTSSTTTSTTSNTTTTASTGANITQNTSSSIQNPATNATVKISSTNGTYEERTEGDIKIIAEKRKFTDEKGLEVEIETETKIEKDNSTIKEEERIFKDKFGNEVKIKAKIEIKADGTIVTDEDREFVNKDGKLVKIKIRIETDGGSIKIKREIEVEDIGIESDLEISEEFEDDEVKLKANLSNGNMQEIKIMPDRASQIALEKLGFNDFEIELKEVGKGKEIKAVYVAEGDKSGKLFGIFKIKFLLKTEIDSETGEIVNLDKPWWEFLVAQ